MKLIFAQGNPGSEYQNSRHNVGFMALDALASSLGAAWLDKPRFNAMLAETQIAGEKALLVKPTSFYNETGPAARQIIDFYKIDKANDMLVIHDDLDLPFGTIRLRKQGSDAGNNGIKSLNTHLDPSYTRIRIGTHNDLHRQVDGASFVLSKFNGDELAQLREKIIPKVIELAERFCTSSIEPISYKLI